MGRGGVSPSHFFYDMTFPEAAAYLRGMESKEKHEWEKIRVVMGGLGKELNLPWDKGGVVEVDETELERLRELSKNIKL